MSLPRDLKAEEEVKKYIMPNCPVKVEIDPQTGAQIVTIASAENGQTLVFNGQDFTTNSSISHPVAVPSKTVAKSTPSNTSTATTISKSTVSEEKVSEEDQKAAFEKAGEEARERLRNTSFFKNSRRPTKISIGVASNGGQIIFGNSRKS